MPSILACLLFSAGIILLLHAGYSAINHFAYLKTIGKHDSNLPTDIIFEILVSIVVFSQGAVMVAGDLKPISLQLELSQKTMDWVDATPGFKIVNHRGSALFAE
ncbi:hypothetical protein BATDEDRAFT_87255 [Batrachochytrium dendrobatidis JAM81]|uniref:Membrane magnesium transporter n=2 Tax=Batrachochytrium dendrobatidis TaxID=109871 RepID=F4NZ17_BATDJ|nr:uncharacterized protein BATDEDRAFT_87255 [Batrachochytrium dendrobatidis JAM81]EGF81806.1 hypothetical protein BATDEDRAFT_87255 [Batrachochytrium dendrobatidis JAM81]KAJ8324698.1 hypothetical protein O5D80_006939 [Batrachochytrium dendrobatidis]KAK5670945.1 hypothetical protein QVD99_002716 [Batrachochytrium dendrobatidis]OAJ40374.1 hypothetical protein BDEG_24119 [Batrachochytrium dendrobatidis JEL423]|eukprot:XP_006677540.1 hypothetical protein BATDEDRAFT_87255 [Batrachochytrium dendrobatidis JAM81]